MTTVAVFVFFIGPNDVIARDVLFLVSEAVVGVMTIISLCECETASSDGEFLFAATEFDKYQMFFRHS